MATEQETSIVMKNGQGTGLVPIRVDKGADAINASIVGLRPRLTSLLQSARDLSVVAGAVAVTIVPTVLFSLKVANQHATLKRYLKFYDTSAGVTVGTTAVVITIVLQPASARSVDFTVYGRMFANGLAYAATTAIADNDTGAPSANDVVIEDMEYRSI